MYAERATVKSTLGAAYVSSFPPRACGIATFTRDLSNAVEHSGRRVATRIAAINDDGAVYGYPQQVRWSIDQGCAQSWRDVAAKINRSPVTLVSIQHEFGLYGRFERDGHFVDFLAGFLERLEKPVVATLHTVLPRPRPDVKAAVRALHDRSERVITMVNMARLILQEEYDLDPAKLITIPHGVPEVRQTDPDRIKHGLQLAGRTVLSTFGLLSVGKGIEYVIHALPDVIACHPDVLYLVLGETHPEVRRREGETYRNGLIALIRSLHLEKHVRFVNQYSTQQQLIRYLQATDIYITPYVDRYQITSGTLAYALGCGKAVISTPYLYAAEALAEGRGLLAEFQDPPSFARCINLLLENGALRAQCESGAFAYGRTMGWSAVGACYADLFHTLAGPPPRLRSVRPIALVQAGPPDIDRLWQHAATLSTGRRPPIALSRAWPARIARGTGASAGDARPSLLPSRRLTMDSLALREPDGAARPHLAIVPTQPARRAGGTGASTKRTERDDV
jgi:glycosyltransferase involved in cell wall biosynthesis